VDDFEDPGFYFLAHEVVMDVGFVRLGDFDDFDNAIAPVLSANSVVVVVANDMALSTWMARVADSGAWRRT
jgi:hypothetical protein